MDQRDLDWTNGDDTHLRSSLLEINIALNGMRGLKRGGIKALPAQVADRLSGLIAKCKRFGLFLVPVGELEYWLADCQISASKKKKWAWANEASDFIRQHPARNDDIWEFTASVGKYLSEQFN